MTYSDFTPTQQDLINTLMSLMPESRMQIVNYIESMTLKNIEVKVRDGFDFGDKVG